MPRRGKKSGLAEGATTAQAPGRGRKRRVDLAAIFRLTPEQIADLEAVATETEVSPEDIALLAGAHTSIAVTGLCASMIEDAERRAAEKAERLAHLKTRQPRPDVIPEE